MLAARLGRIGRIDNGYRRLDMPRSTAWPSAAGQAGGKKAAKADDSALKRRHAWTEYFMS